MAIINKFPGGGDGGIVVPSGYDNIIVKLDTITNLLTESGSSHYMSTSKLDNITFYSFFPSSKHMIELYAGSSKYNANCGKFFATSEIVASIYLGVNSGSGSNGTLQGNYTFVPGVFYSVAMKKSVIYSSTWWKTHLSLYIYSNDKLDKTFSISGGSSSGTNYIYYQVKGTIIRKV